MRFGGSLVWLVSLTSCGSDPAGSLGDAGPHDGGDVDSDADSDTGTPDAGADAGPPIDPSDEIYDPLNFPRFDLELSDESIAALYADPRTYVRATFRYGDEVLTDVGVHLKGEYTFRTLDAKAAFKIKFDEFVPDQTFRGLKRMTLNNSFEDESRVAERLAYQAFRSADLPAPRCNSATVYVNDEPYGVYSNVETEDKTFLSRWFASNDGNLYEETGSDFYQGNEYAFELETNETADDRSDLTALFDAIAGSQPETFLDDLEPILDMTAFLRYSAMEGIVNQWDGYPYTRFWPNNFRIYNDPTTGKFHFLPWGIDMSMQPFPGSADVWLPLWEPYSLIFWRCLQSGPCTTAYEETLAELVELYDSLDLEDDADAMYEQIAEEVYADPRDEHGTDVFESFFEFVRNFPRDRPDTVRAELP